MERSVWQNGFSYLMKDPSEWPFNRNFAEKKKQDSITIPRNEVNRKYQDQNQKKSVISHRLPSSHQIAHQPWKNPVHFKQQETRRVAPKRLISADIDIFGSDHQYQPKLRQGSLASTKVVAKKEPPSYNSNMSARMHNNVFERRSSVTKQQDMKVEMDIDASRGLRF